MNVMYSRLRASACPDAASIDTATARSSPTPTFRMSAGARLMVILASGKSYPEFRKAALTRSRDSRTVQSGRPTMSNEGKPLARSASTATGTPEMPMTAQPLAIASIRNLPPH
mgnify:CR=1 FL=1